MSGGAWEYVMGDIVTSGNVPMVGDTSSNNSGFTGVLSDGTTYSGIDFPNSKYYDLYTYDTSNTSQSRGKLGDSTKETLITYGVGTKGWYGDYKYFVWSASQWFVRGGYYGSGAYAGIFDSIIFKVKRLLIMELGLLLQQNNCVYKI